MDGIYKRGDIWYIDYRVSGRRYREAVGESKKLAELALKKRKLAIAEGKFLDIRRQEKIKFETFADDYLQIHSANNKTYDNDESTMKVLKAFFGGKHLHEITQLDVEKFKTERAKTVSAATVNRALALLKSAYNRAIEWSKVEVNPVCKVKLFKENNQRLRYLEAEEIEKLLNSCDGYLKGVITVAIFTGMRRGEILNLKWHDCDFERRVIRLTNTKNNEVRAIPMNDIVWKALIAMPKHPNSAYVFYDTNGRPFHNLRKSFFTTLTKCNIMNFHFHDLRHTFASQLVMSGVDLNTVRELLGHKSLEMTLRYSHLSPDHKKRAVDILANRMDTKRSQMPIDETDEKLTASQLFENIAVTHSGL